MSCRFYYGVCVGVVVCDYIDARVIYRFAYEANFISLLFRAFLRTDFVSVVSFFLGSLFYGVRQRSMDVVWFRYVFTKGYFLSYYFRLVFRLSGSAGALIGNLIRLIFFVYRGFGSGFFLLFRLQVSYFKAVSRFFAWFYGRKTFSSGGASIAYYAAGRATRCVATTFIYERSAIKSRGYYEASVVYSRACKCIVIVVLLMFFSKGLACRIARYTSNVCVRSKVCILRGGYRAFRARAYVGILLFRYYVVSVSVILGLNGCIIPCFRMAITIASCYATEFPTTMLLSAIVMSF